MLDFHRKPDIITFVLTREQNKKPRAQSKIAGLCKGSTTDSDSVCEGSNPSPAAKAKTAETVATQQFRRFSFILFPAAPAENLTLLGQLAGGNDCEICSFVDEAIKPLFYSIYNCPDLTKHEHNEKRWNDIKALLRIK